MSKLERREIGKWAIAKMGKLARIGKMGTLAIRGNRENRERERVCVCVCVCGK